MRISNSKRYRKWKFRKTSAFIWYLKSLSHIHSWYSETSQWKFKEFYGFVGNSSNVKIIAIVKLKCHCEEAQLYEAKRMFLASNFCLLMSSVSWDKWIKRDWTIRFFFIYFRGEKKATWSRSWGRDEFLNIFSPATELGFLRLSFPHTVRGFAIKIPFVK